MEENWLNPEYVNYYNRNYATSAEEFRGYLDLLQVGEGDCLVDFGCGNGDFLEVARERNCRLVGVDISSVQIEAAKGRLSSCDSALLVCCPFVDFVPANLGGQRQPLQFSKGFSRKALHHLTDAEKALWLAHVAPSFVAGAQLYIEDGIFFEFEREELDSHWDKLLGQAAAYYGESWAEKEHDLRHSFRDEYPTGVGYWKKILADNGFHLAWQRPRCSFYGGILAVKD